MPTLVSGFTRDETLQPDRTTKRDVGVSVVLRLNFFIFVILI